MTPAGKLTAPTVHRTAPTLTPQRKEGTLTAMRSAPTLNPQKKDGVFRGAGSWRAPPKPPSADQLRRARSRTFAENWKLERNTGGIPRVGSTPSMPLARRSPPRLSTDPPPPPPVRRVVFGSRAWLIANRRWPGFPNPKFSVTGAKAPWKLDYDAEISKSSALVSGKAVNAIGAGRDLLDDAEDQIRRYWEAGGGVDGDLPEDQTESVMSNTEKASVRRRAVKKVHRKPPTLEVDPKAPPTLGAIVTAGQGSHIWRKKMLETQAVRAMLQKARAALREQRLATWSDSTDAAIPSLTILVEIKCHSRWRGGYHGFSVIHDAEKYDDALKRLEEKIGNAIPPPDPNSEAPPIPVKIQLANVPRERYHPMQTNSYPRKGAERQMQAILEAYAEKDGRNPVVETVKTDYQLPDNLSFTGEHVNDRRHGVEACRLGACEVFLVTCQDVPAGHVTPAAEGADFGTTAGAAAARPTLRPYYGLHSKLWTRRFPNAENVLKRCQECLEPVFRRYDADVILRSLLKQTEALHGSGGGGEMWKQAESVGDAVENLEAAIEKHGTHASTPIAAWAERALAALRELHSIYARGAASRSFSDLGLE